MENFQRIWKEVESLRDKARKECIDFLLKELKSNNSRIDVTEYDDAVTVTYDGGKHPEYASNVYSVVSAIYLSNGDICLDIEDCDEYSINRINTDELYSVCWAVLKGKPFTCGKTTISRSVLESCPCPFDTDCATDTIMQTIASNVENEMKEWYDWEKDGTVTADKVQEKWWEILEREVVAAGIPYYEDEE